MICYKDKSFCAYPEDCIDKKNCDNVLTENDIRKASELRLPICYNNMDCYRKAE